MSSRWRILVLVLAAAALAGGSYYVLAIYLPQQKYGPAQDEIARWEARVATVRECLLGPKPGSSKLREALAIYQLSVKDPWRDRTPCARRIGGLSRGETEDTGLPAVEDAWEHLEAAAIGLAKAYVEYVDPLTSDKAPPARDPLEEAFARLDAAHAALRHAAELPPLPALAATPPLPVAQVIPLPTDRGPATEIRRSGFQMNRAFVSARAGQRRVWFALAPGAAPVASDVAPDVTPSASGARWGALIDADRVTFGPLDESGLPPLTESAKDPRAVAIEGGAEVVAMTGTDESGVALVRMFKSSGAWFVVVRSKAGKLAADRPVEFDSLEHAIDASGRMLVSFRNAAGSAAFIADGAGPAEIVPLGSIRAGHVCLSATRGWIADWARTDAAGYQTVTLAATGAPPATLEGELNGCNDQHALLVVARSRYRVCADTCRDVAVPDAVSNAKIVLAGDRIAGTIARDRVLAVWREGAALAFYALDQPRKILFALADGKTIDLITQSNEGIAIVRIPAV